MRRMKSTKPWLGIAVGALMSMVVFLVVGSASATPANAASLFDDAMALNDVAAPAVDRFPPPVASAGDSPVNVAAAAQPFAPTDRRLLAPCDTPGSGCRNVSASGSAFNPPIIPGGPPPIPVP